MPLHARQSDLLFLWQETQPAVDLDARRSPVIVAGEATSHAHRLQAGTILDALDGARSLDVTHPPQVVHEEHGLITQERGLWRVVRQREYSPEATREVLD